MILGGGWGGFPPPNVRSRVGHFGSKPQISHPSWSKLVQKIRFVLNFLLKIGTICLILSCFVSIGHILTHLVKFGLFQSYFTHIISYLWYFFSWSTSHQIDKVGQIVDAPPNRLPQESSLLTSIKGYQGLLKITKGQ